MAAKKELAFALFDQGKRPSDPEVKELDVKKETLCRYFTYWKSNNPSRTEADNPSRPRCASMTKSAVCAILKAQGKAVDCGLVNYGKENQLDGATKRDS